MTLETNNVDSTEGEKTIDIEEFMLPLKSSTSGLSSARQLIDTTSTIEVSFDTTA